MASYVVRAGRNSPDLHRPNMSDLRIVLLGKNSSENIRVKNSILGKEVSTRESQESSQHVLHHSERISGSVENRQISVFDLSLHQCMDLSDPGPHVFILILQYNDFSEEDRFRVKTVLKEFSDEAVKRTIVLTTDDETYGDMSTSERTNEFIIDLIKECGGGHLQFEEQAEWLSEMFRIIDELQKREPDQYLKSSVNSKLNVVLCGADATLKVIMSKLMRGKLNQPLNQKVSISSVCVKREEKIHGRQICVVNLPALTGLSHEEMMHQTLNCVSLCGPGAHVFLIIIPVGPLTDEDKGEIEKIQKIFTSTDHFMMIFMSDVTVDRSVTDFVDSYAESQRLIRLCAGRYRVIGLKENSNQIPDLLEYIENMKTEPYSLQMFVRAQEMRVRRETEEKYEEKL